MNFFVFFSLFCLSNSFIISIPPQNFNKTYACIPFIFSICNFFPFVFYWNPKKKKKTTSCAEKYANINWDELGFGLIPIDYMYMMKCSEEKNFSHGNLVPYGNIEMSPSAGILNYGQVVHPQPPKKTSLLLTYTLIYIRIQMMSLGVA
jgi:hypothetical protein